MIFTITIFLLAVIIAFGVLSFSAWEVKQGARSNDSYPVFKISVKKTEKYLLYYTKYILQAILLTLAKYWFLALAKIKKWISETLPKVHSMFKYRDLEPGERPSFLRKAVLESKTKIKRIREDIKEDHQ